VKLPVNQTSYTGPSTAEDRTYGRIANPREGSFPGDELWALEGHRRRRDRHKVRVDRQRVTRP